MACPTQHMENLKGRCLLLWPFYSVLFCRGLFFFFDGDAAPRSRRAPGFNRTKQTRQSRANRSFRVCASVCLCARVLLCLR